MRKTISPAVRRLSVVIAILTMLIGPMLMTGCSSNSVEGEWVYDGDYNFRINLGPNGEGKISFYVDGVTVTRDIKYKIIEDRVEYSDNENLLQDFLFIRNGELYTPDGEPMSRVNRVGSSSSSSSAYGHSPDSGISFWGCLLVLVLAFVVFAVYCNVGVAVPKKTEEGESANETVDLVAPWKTFLYLLVVLIGIGFMAVKFDLTYRNFSYDFILVIALIMNFMAFVEMDTWKEYRGKGASYYIVKTVLWLSTILYGWQLIANIFLSCAN